MHPQIISWRRGVCIAPDCQLQDSFCQPEKIVPGQDATLKPNEAKKLPPRGVGLVVMLDIRRNYVGGGQFGVAILRPRSIGSDFID